MRQRYALIPSRLAAAVAAIVLSVALPVSALKSFGSAPDFNAARDEAAHILAGFVRIDTSNPPGNETKGAQYLKSVLCREGIASEIFESVPGRGNTRMQSMERLIPEGVSGDETFTAL